MNLDDRCGSRRRLVRTFAVLMVGAALGATRGREILSLPAGGGDSCAIVAGAHYAAFPSAAGQTSPPRR